MVRVPNVASVILFPVSCCSTIDSATVIVVKHTVLFYLPSRFVGRN